MPRLFVLTYGIVCYALGMASLVYLAGFLIDFGVPRSVDSPVAGSLVPALLVNLGLVGIFGLQHSLMARPTFKRWWKRFVPEPIERSTYVLFSAAALGLLFWQWRPLGVIVWDAQQPLLRAGLYAVYGAGWGTVLVVTFLINHFDLFGLRQVWLRFRSRDYRPLGFVVPGPYRIVRHPLYVGWLTVFWATPTMSAAHLLLATGITAYILIAIRLEERNLVEFHPQYADYRRRVPMLVPRLRTERPAPVRPDSAVSRTAAAQRV